MGLEIESIEALDIQTMMAVSSEKYQPIIEELAENPLSVQEVRSRMKSINQEAKKVAPTKSDVIRRDVNGQRYAQIPPVYDQNAISSLARQMSMEGKSAQTIAAEGLLLREKAILALKGLEIPEQLSEAIALILPTEEIVPLIEKEATLVEASPQTWEKAQQELAEYIESQSEETAPASRLEIGDKRGVAGQVGIIVDFEEKPLINETYPVIAWSSGGTSILSPQNVEVIEKAATSKKVEFAIGEKVWYRGERYTVASEPDEDGDILVERLNGATRFLQGTVLQKLE
ncbi:hypothetical protein [Scytonema sp. PCC 10023]|uniref:hypothetical protein n=1 Tax=Scytonema sp. PCC 10023 TaxID=1680591 RepID=UPI0039C6B9A4